MLLVDTLSPHAYTCPQLRTRTPHLPSQRYGIGAVPSRLLMTAINWAMVFVPGRLSKLFAATCYTNRPPPNLVVQCLVVHRNETYCCCNATVQQEKHVLPALQTFLQLLYRTELGEAALCHSRHHLRCPPPAYSSMLEKQVVNLVT